MTNKFRAGSTLGKMTGRIKALIVGLAGFCLLCGLAGPSYGGAVQEANAGREGQTIDLKSLPVKGKITVVDFFSQYCPPCMAIAPLMEKLAQKRSDLAIKKVNIQRPAVSGHIDWQSPLAQQMGFGSIGIPYFMVFNEQGELTAKGDAARQKVIGWLKEAGLLKQ